MLPPPIPLQQEMSASSLLLAWIQQEWRGSRGMIQNLANSSLSALLGLYDKPSLSTNGCLVVMPGESVSLRCSSAHTSFDRFSLSKERRAALSQHQNGGRWGDFILGPVNLSFSGIYTCYSWYSGSPYVWSAPSDALQLVVTGKCTPAHTCVLFLRALADCSGPWHQAGIQRDALRKNSGAGESHYSEDHEERRSTSLSILLLRDI